MSHVMVFSNRFTKLSPFYTYSAIFSLCLFFLGRPIGWIGGHFLPSSFQATHNLKSTIETIEQVYGLPKGLLFAIACVESGLTRGKQGYGPWPWTINVNTHRNHGKTIPAQSLRFDTKDQAVAYARRLKNQGIENIDVGCMQINMKAHPKAFTSFEEAFDPLQNIRYSAIFLIYLREKKGLNWRETVGAYHAGSPNTSRGQAYAERVEKKKTETRSPMIIS